MPKRLQVVNIRLDDEAVTVLREEANRQHRAMANLISAVVMDYVEVLKAEKAKKT